MKRPLSHMPLLLLLTMLSAVLPSCINDDGSCPEPPNPEKGLTLKFQIATAYDATSRSLTDPATRDADLEGEGEGSGAENYLNLNTLRYLIFDKDRKYVTDLSAKAETVAVTENFRLYEVTANVNDPYFMDTANSDGGMLEFYIFVLANCTDPRWMPVMPVITTATTITDLFDNGLLFNNSVPNSMNLMEAVTNGTASRFAMAGLQRFRINQGMMLDTYKNLPFDITRVTGNTVNMLRPVAKIEIVDKINVGETFNEETDRLNFRIKDASLWGQMSQGRLLPTLDQWSRNVAYPETQQVIAPSIPADAAYLLPPPLNPDFTIGTADNVSAGNERKFAPDKVATDKRTDKCPVYSCYVYEYSKARIPAVLTTQQPYLSVVLERPVTNPDGTTTTETVTYPLRLAKYTNGEASAADNIDQLLRNHIYRYEITGIQSYLTVDWTVCEMDKAPEVDIVYN